MNNLKLLGKLLHLKEMKIIWFQFKNYDRELHLGVKPYKNGCRCPICERRGRIVRQGTDVRIWTDIALFGIRVVMHYAPKEIQCPTHGCLQEQIPWAAYHSRITHRLEYRICAFCQIMTQKCRRS